MKKKRIQALSLPLQGIHLPEKSEFVAWAQVLEITEVHPDTLTELVDIEWIVPQRTQTDEYLFRLKDVYRIHKLLRLVNDLNISFTGGSIIVDLLERVEELEKEIVGLKQLV